ncbi:MAG TPA: dynamin family protein [Candidatus Methylomirabilis sp.]|nr:dynamin family protein [Candidatus Methylomirabilis sp.]
MGDENEVVEPVPRSVGGSTVAGTTSPAQTAFALRLLAEEAGYGPIALELEALEQRTREGRFYVAVIGQFKRGKSTLINALLETRLLPTGVPPVTSVVTLLRGGVERRVTVHFRHTPSAEVPESQLSEYVSEASNPGNARGVAVVEVEWPSPLLESGLCLVDTPGVGSILEANAHETHAFVPHVDAALLVLGVDPPISAAEMELVRALLTERPPVIVVVNKADLMNQADLDAGVAFTRRALKDVLGQDPLLLLVSARCSLERRALADGRPEGGLPDLRASLDALARSSGAALAQGALARGTSRARCALVQALQLERRALIEPVQDLARLEGILATEAERITDFLADFAYRLRGELDRFGTALQERRDTFITAAAGDAERIAGDAVSVWDASPSAQAEREAVAAAWERLLERLKQWERQLLPWVDAQQHALAERFTVEAQRLLVGLRREAASLLREMLPPEIPGPRFAPTARYYLAADAAVGAIDVSGVAQRLLYALLLYDVLRKRLERRLVGRVETWARHNATRVASEIWQAAEDARRVFQYDLERSVQDAAQVAQTALNRAREQRARGEAAVAADLARLDDLLRRCEAVGVLGAPARGAQGDP